MGSIFFALQLIGVLAAAGWCAAPVQAATITTAAELGLFYGDELNEDIGKGVAGAGDVDGDGYGDVIIGAPGSGDEARGAAYLVYGAPAKIDQWDLSQAVAFTGEASGDKLGSTVAGLGDINGDGYADLAVTSLYHDGNKRNAGTIYIIYGQAERFISQPIKNFPSLTGTEDNARIGAVVVGLGDMNGDGYADAAIGASNRDSRSGGVYILYGQAEALASSIVSSLALFSGDHDYDYAGTAVAGAGDINADGLADLLVSAPKYNSSERDTGIVYIVYGQASAYASEHIGTAAGATITGLTTSERIGQSLALTDLNNDTFADIIIGASYNDDGGTNAGAIYLVYGDNNLVGDQTLADSVQLHGTNEADIAGLSLAAPGDLTGDGYNDVMVGAPSTSEVQPGRLFIVIGAATRLAAQALTEFDQIDGETLADQFAYDVAAAGDTNGDGHPEALIGAVGYGQAEQGGGAAYLVYWPIPTCDNSAASGGILANYPSSDWKLRHYRANENLRIVVERKGQHGLLVNCKTDQIVQTLTFNTKAQRKILARVFQARGQSVFIAVTRTYSRRKIKVFFYRQHRNQLTLLDYFTTKWRPRGLRIKLRRKNHVILQKGKEKKHRLVYWINLDMKLQRS